MKIYHNQLANTLKQGSKPVWLIFGDEAWQKNNSLQQIKHHAKAQGFNELLRFSVDDKFDWQQLIDEYNSLSLFANQRIIEVEFTSIKVGDKGNKALMTLSEILHNDVILIFHGGKLDNATSNRKWFKNLAKQGCYIPLYALEGKALHQWLQQQVSQLGLQLDPQVFPLLIALFEGNILALEQELQKLVIIYGNNPISLADAEALVINQAKFNPFQLIDALLIGDLAKVIRILDQQYQEGVNIAQLIWFIHKEINTLLTIQLHLKQGVVLSAIFKEQRIWDKRKPLYQHAISHTSIASLTSALSRLADVDLISKTSSEFNPFILLADVCVSLYHSEQLNPFPLNYEFS
jgi:DNA polymerase-3 subunit delta